MDSAAAATPPAAVPPGAASPKVAEIRDLILAKLRYAVGKNVASASKHDWFIATALSVRDKVVDSWLSSIARAKESGAKRVYYLSLEFLIGRLLIDALTNIPQETLRIELQDSAASALFTLPDAPGFKYVVMPMRI